MLLWFGLQNKRFDERSTYYKSKKRLNSTFSVINQNIIFDLEKKCENQAYIIKREYVYHYIDVQVCLMSSVFDVTLLLVDF